MEAETAAKRVKALDAHIAVLDYAVAKAKALGEQRQQETETAAKRGEAPEASVATMGAAVGQADTLREQRQQATETAAKRVETLEAYIAMLEEAAAKTEALGEQRQQEVETAAKKSRPWKPIMLCWRKPSPRPKYRASRSARKPRQRPSGPTISFPNSSR